MTCGAGDFKIGSPCPLKRGYGYGAEHVHGSKSRLDPSCTQKGLHLPTWAHDFSWNRRLGSPRIITSSGREERWSWDAEILVSNYSKWHYQWLSMLLLMILVHFHSQIRPAFHILREDVACGITQLVRCHAFKGGHHTWRITSRCRNIQQDHSG